MDAARLRSAFPVLQDKAYLNAGTCGPVPEAAHRAACEASRFGLEAGRTGAFYERLTALSDQLRERYAQLVGAAQPGDIALVGGTSDGIGRVIAGLELQPGDEIVTADDEHPGLQGPLAAAREQRGVTIRAVPLADVADAVSRATRLVACSHVSWASGEVAPVDALRHVARDIPVLLDGAQGVGAVPVDVAALGVTFYGGSGQKWLCGPVGTGLLWVDPDWRERIAVGAPAYGNLAEPIRGLESALAPDAKRFDAPSQDLASIAAAVAAFDVLAETGWASIHARSAAMAAQLADAMRDAGIEVVPRGASPLVSWACGSDDEAVAERDRLGAAGVVVRNLPGTSRLRASVGAWNDEEDLERLVGALASR